MEIKEALCQGIYFLKEREYTNPLLEVRVLLSHFLKKDMSYLIAHENEEIPKEIKEKYFEALARREKGEPLQYILGHTEFMKYDFYIDYNVLIPRNDTEISAEVLLDLIEKHHVTSFIELGCGSGVVSAIVAMKTDAKVTAVDISQYALENTRKNRDYYGLDFSILKSDLFENVIGKYDMIYSNPPYIPSRIINQLQKEVKDYEPRLALDGGEDGLDFYRRIIASADGFLKPKGFLVFEMGFDQGEDLKKMMESYHPYIMKDLNGMDRVIIGQKE